MSATKAAVVIAVVMWLEGAWFIARVDKSRAVLGGDRPFVAMIYLTWPLWATLVLVLRVYDAIRAAILDQPEAI